MVIIHPQIFFAKFPPDTLKKLYIIHSPTPLMWGNPAECMNYTAYQRILAKLFIFCVIPDNDFFCDSKLSLVAIATLK